jgi:DNA (cytosine-5)-methyltransferase 1
MHKGPRGTEAVESNHVVAIQDVRGLDKKQNGKGWSDEGVSYTVDTHATQGVAMCEIDTVGTLRAHHPGTAGVHSDTDHIVAFDTTQISSPHNYSNPQPGDPCHPLAAGAHPPAIAFAIQERAVCENPDAGPDGIGVRADDAAYTLEARSTPQAVAYDAAHAFKVRGGCEGGGKGYLGSDEVAFTLSTNQDQHIFSEPAIGFDAYNNDVTGDVSKTVDTGQDYHHVPIAFQPTADCLTAAYGTKWNGNASATNGSLFAQQQSTVRRLTPVECERLQGFPDNFTAIPWRKKGAEDCPDGPRYKALGNSMAVPVMRWIGERIRLIDDYISII